MASYKEDDRPGSRAMPSLDDLEPGRMCGAVLPLSERARIEMRDSMEVVEYLLNQERVVWS
jgi:hypothetical protein